MTTYAFFDFDGTLTRKDSVLPFLRFCCASRWVFYGKLLFLLPVLLGYLLGWVSNSRAKESVIGAYLRGWREADVLQKAREFAQTELPQFLLDEGMAKLAFHRARGDVCVLVSASPEWYLLDWAREQGFEAVLATKMAVVSGCLNGKIAGENCHDEAKVRRIEAAFGAQCWQNSVAYSDAKVDLPMLRAAGQGFLLNQKTGRFELLAV